MDLIEVIFSCAIVTAIVGVLMFYSNKMMINKTKKSVVSMVLIYAVFWALFVAIIMSIYLKITLLTYIAAGSFAAIVFISVVIFVLIKKHNQKTIDTNYDYSAVGKVIGMRAYKAILNTVTYFMLIEFKDANTGNQVVAKTVDDYKIEDIAFYCSLKENVNIIVKGGICRVTTQISPTYKYNPEDLEEIRQGKNF